jgi:hypothetical protein
MMKWVFFRFFLFAFFVFFEGVITWNWIVRYFSDLTLYRQSINNLQILIENIIYYRSTFKKG